MGDKTWGNSGYRHIVYTSSIAVVEHAALWSIEIHCYDSIIWNETFIVLYVDAEKLGRVNINILQGSYYARRVLELLWK
jgi:hypothetical protein